MLSLHVTASSRTDDTIDNHVVLFAMVHLKLTELPHSITHAARNDYI